ncbi:2-deoxy-D-gluconate 3-dehydrogenase [Halteromyces radiatus]|uniref:2-deoxy-D-gluconate 3-dehydrogenase n=1 Tax=Halteromyces radiatus TaxID=101107 RepID=UPI002220A5B7|nr:2-deoxy-D-gluconate 3-dehydrogenase [Halteromyces radiatus]KAI8088971.1 2-deoxy-D-gluconate 3-dehydrogenase [Halteromyces radiatus]
MSDSLSLFSLSGKVALISGCTRGIGKSMTLGLAEAGADIVLLQRDINNTTVYDAIKALGRQCYIVAYDSSDPSSVRTVIDRVLQVVPTFDILVNNAGITRRHSADTFPEEDWDLVLQVNLKSVWQVSQAAGRHFLALKKPGKIISTASLMSYQGGILTTAYAASKGGLATMTKALANEWASSGIAVNAIAPGYVATDLTAALKSSDREPSISSRIPAGRWATPDDFKGPVVFLASRASDYVHGELLVVDGGWMGR